MAEFRPVLIDLPEQLVGDRITVRAWRELDAADLFSLIDGNLRPRITPLCQDLLELGLCSESDVRMEATYRPIPFVIPRLEPEEQLARSRRFLNVMQQRRSIRFFSDEPIPFELIENAIRAAASAPSGANQQPWTFVVVTDPAVRARIRAEAEAEERRFYESNLEEWHAALAPLGTDWHKEHLTKAPYLIVVFVQSWSTQTDPATGEQRRIKHYYVQESVGIAVGILLASLTHAGLATLTHTPSPMGFLSRILNRPKNERPYLVIPVGYPADDCTVPDIQKKPLDEILIRI